MYPKIGFLSLRLANWGEQIWTLRQIPAMQAERNGEQRLEVAALFPCAMHNDALQNGRLFFLSYNCGDPPLRASAEWYRMGHLTR